MLSTAMLLSTLAHKQDFGKVDLDTAIQTVRRIADVCQKADGGLSDWTWRTKASATFEVNDKVDWVVLTLGQSRARFVRSTGEFLTINFTLGLGEGTHQSRLIKESDGLAEEACLAKAKDYLRVVVPIDNLEVLFTFKEPQGVTDDKLSLRWFDFQGVPKVGDLRMADQYGFRAKIDRTRGQLLEMKVPDMPDVTAATDARLPVGELEQIAKTAYQQGHPFKNSKYWSQGLQLEVPAIGDATKLPSEYRAMIKAYKAIPVFVLWIADLDSKVGDSGQITRSQTVTLDARNGTVLGIEDR